MGVDVFLCDGLRVFFGDLLDVDATLGGDHGDGFALAAVHRHADVVLVDEVDALLDEHFVDVVAFEIHAEDRFGCLAGLVFVGCDLDAAGLAAAADVDLCLDSCWIPNLADSVEYTLDTVCELRCRDWNPCVCKDFLRLILVEFHTSV